MAQGGTITIKTLLDTSDALSAKRRLETELKNIPSEGLRDIGEAADDAADSIDGIGEAAERSSGGFGRLKGAADEFRAGLAGIPLIGAALNPAALGVAAVTAGVVALGAASVDVARDYEGSASKIKASFGTTTEEAERLRNVAASIYEDGFGESLDGITDSMVTVKERIRDIDDEGLKYVTTGVQTMADVFDADVSESVKGVNVLMDKFGLSAMEATDLMAAGMQNGLNFSDELGDNLSEYSGRWAEAGMSASQYFSLLQAGTENGAYQLDKVGDFLNEFLTSLTDGRMDEGIGNFSQGTQDVFNAFKDGKATAEDVLNAVTTEMAGMTDETKRAKIAGELWSSLGEDNAMGMITALGGVEDSYGSVQAAAFLMAQDASENIESKINSTLRTMQRLLEPVGGFLIGIAGGFLDAANACMTFLQGDTSAFGEEFEALWLDVIEPFVANAMQPLLNLWEQIVRAGGELGEKLAQLQPLLDAVAAVVGGVFAAAFIAGYGAVNGLGQMFLGVIETIGGFVDYIAGLGMVLMGLLTGNQAQVDEGLQKMFSGAGAIVSGIFNGILGFFEGFVTSVLDLLGFHGLADTVRGVFDSVRRFIEDPVGNARQFVHDAIEGIKGFFNFNWRLPELKLPHIHVGEYIDVPVLGRIPNPTTLRVDWYKTGGVFADGPQIIGIGEGGKEAALPLEGHHMRPFAVAVAKEMPKEDGGGSVTIIIERFVHSGSEADDEELLRRIAQKVKTRQRAGGLAA